MVSEDAANWILKHERLQKNVVQGEIPLEKLAKEAYRGETGAAYQTSDKLFKKINKFKELLDSGDMNSIESFLDQNPDYPLDAAIVHIDYYNPLNNFSLPPLWYVYERIDSNKKDLMKFLVSRGASPNIKNRSSTLLYASVSENNFDMTNFLLGLSGIDVNSQDNQGNTILHYIANNLSKETDLINRLIQQGGDIHVTNKESYSPLSLAARKGNLDFIHTILHHPTLSPQTGLSSIEFDLEKYNLDEVMGLLKEQGVAETIHEAVFYGGKIEDIIHICDHLHQLSSLKINNTIIGDKGLNYIIKIPNLTSLDLHGNKIGAEGAEVIATIRGLESLSLSSNQIGDEGAKVIVDNLKNLHTLALSFNKIGDEGAKVIAENLKNLHTLDLSFNKIGDEGVKVIAENLKNLHTLDLSGNKIMVEGVKAISTLTGLRKLSLGPVRIGVEGVNVLAKSLKELQSLNLPYSKIGDTDAQVIAENLKKLQFLDLSDNDIGSVGVNALVKNLTKLQSLDLSNNSGAKMCCQPLKNKFPFLIL